MKRFIRVIVILLLSFIEVTDIKAQKGLIVYGQDTLCFKTSDILGISHNDFTNNTVSFECKDTIITKQITDIDSISLKNLPDCIILKDNIGEWSDMRICKDGTIALSKMREDGTPSEISMITPNDSLESIFSYIIFDEKEYPVEIIMNNLKIQSFWINDETINLTVIFSDSLSVRYDSLSIVKNDVARVRSTRVPNVDEKSWQMRLGGLLEAAGGVGSMTVGGVIILGSGAATLFTDGIAAPVSIPGLSIGTFIAYNGFRNVYNGFMNAFSPNNYIIGWDQQINTVLTQGATETLQRAPDYIMQLLDENGIRYERGYVAIPELGAGVANASYISLLCTIWGQMLSNSARPFTWFDLVRAVYDNVLTGVVVDVSHNSATIRGYIGPYILESPNGKFETEYGIVVNSSSDEDAPYKSEPIINGNGGLIEYTFNDLKLATEYEYCTYYIDKTNGVYVLGEKKTFKTDDLGVETGDIKNKKSTSVDAYGQILAVDLSIISKSKYEYGICFTDKSSEEDWTFIPSNNLDSGGFFSVSLSNLKPKTKYTYCAYLELGEDDYLYGVEETFETEKKSDETNLCPVTLSNFFVHRLENNDGYYGFEYFIDANVTATLDEATEGIAEWGVVFNANTNDILEELHRNKNPSEHTFSVSDLYYLNRNGTQPLTCTLYGYVKYVGSDKPVYSEPYEFPVDVCPDSNHPHWIDLGLPSGTLWRCCNEGASTPEDFGGYYTFGQVESAPTKDQVEELVNNTVSLNGIYLDAYYDVYGARFTGPNGKSIFLPMAGWMSYWDNKYYDTWGHYWSSTPLENNDEANGVQYAYYLYYDPERAIYNFFPSNYGFSVRTVRHK